MDPHREKIEAYALGALGGEERSAFEAHLEGGCPPCEADLSAHREALRRLAGSRAPDPRLRQQVLDLSEAPSLPIDPGAYAWQEPFPGFRVATVGEDRERGVRKCLLWGKPGARFPAHRHGGDEAVLVLQGAYRDEERTYGPGDVARRREGSVHSLEILTGEDCISYVVSYGDIEIVERAWVTTDD